MLSQNFSRAVHDYAYDHEHVHVNDNVAVEVLVDVDVDGLSKAEGVKHTPENVKLLLPHRQSRRIS